MFKKLLGKKVEGEVEEKTAETPFIPTVQTVESPEGIVLIVPEKAIEGSHIDPRLIVRTGKRGKTVSIKSPCVPECAGCDKQFKPTPYEGKKYCETNTDPKNVDPIYCKMYTDPGAMWKGLNINGKPKTCLVQVKPKAEKEEKKPLNPLKASKRHVSQISVATGSKESGKK